MPLDENGKRRMATEYERVRCIEAKAEGMKYEDIAAELGMSLRNAKNIVKYWKTTGHLHPPPRPGRPKALDARDVRHLARVSDLHPRATLAEIVNEARVPVRPRTAGKYLRDAGLWVRLALRKPFLNAKMRRRRKAWCRERRKWSKAEWRRVMFTDEMRIQVGAGTDWRRKVRRRKGCNAALLLQNLQPTFVGEPFGVWFWGGFGFGYHSPLVVMR